MAADLATPSSELVKVEDRRPALLMPIATPDQLINRQEVLTTLIVQSLKEGTDYGKIPGTDDKNNLLKPGAERLSLAFGLVADPQIIEKEIDHDRPVHYNLAKWTKAAKPSDEEQAEKKAKGTGRFKKFGNKFSWQEKIEEDGISYGVYRYVVRCDLKDSNGRIVGSGVGSCSSYEAKYIRNPRDSENTVLKMAKKRAFVDATLTTLGLSDRFAQDVEDITENKDVYRVDADEVFDAEVVEATVTDVANWLTLGRDLTQAESDEGTKYFKEVCRGNAEQFKALKSVSGKIHPAAVFLQARKLKITDPVEVIRLIDDTYGYDHIPKAQAVHAGTSSDEPTAEVTSVTDSVTLPMDGNSGSAPPPMLSNPSESLTTAIVAENPYTFDPFADGFDYGEDFRSKLCPEIGWPLFADSPDACSVAYREILGRAIKNATVLTPDDYVKLHEAGRSYLESGEEPGAFKLYRRQREVGVGA